MVSTVAAAFWSAPVLWRFLTECRCRNFPPQQPDQTIFVLARKFMFPDAQDAPAGAAQSAQDELVADPVAGKLFTPERRVALGLGAVFGTAMPKTAIHENCQPQFGKNKIRPHFKFFCF